MSLRHIETGKTWERDMVERDGRLCGYSYGETYCGRWFWYGQERSWAYPPGRPLDGEKPATCAKCRERFAAEEAAEAARWERGSVLDRPTAPDDRTAREQDEEEAP